jgi:hypothetical protein
MKPIIVLLVLAALFATAMCLDDFDQSVETTTVEDQVRDKRWWGYGRPWGLGYGGYGGFYRPWGLGYGYGGYGGFYRPYGGFYGRFWG